MWIVGLYKGGFVLGWGIGILRWCGGGKLLWFCWLDFWYNEVGIVFIGWCVYFFDFRWIWFVDCIFGVF